MGNCLPTTRRRKRANRVEPEPDKNIHEVLSRSTDFRKPTTNDPKDMIKALKDEGTKADDKSATLDSKEGVSQSDKKAAVAFTIDYDTEETKTKVPKRVAARLLADKEPKSQMEYTLDEECLMAEILREDRLKELKDKAIQEDIKVFDAQRRKMAADRDREARAEEKARCSTPSVTDQRQKVKDMAEEDRRKAAERRRAAANTE